MSNVSIIRFGAAALLLGAMVSTGPASVHAQGVGLGVIGGANFATLRGLDDVDLDRRTGAMGGVRLLLPLGTALSLQPEALVVTAGAKPRRGGSNDDGIRLTYAQVPVLLRLAPAGGMPISPHVYAGPYFGMRIRCQVDLDDRDCDDVGSVNTETVDIGGIVGGGLDFDMGGLVLTGGLRYGFGVSKVAEFEAGSVRESAKNGSFSVYAGLGLRFGR